MKILATVVFAMWVAMGPMLPLPSAYAQNELPKLSPGAGGRSLDREALEPGDLILSTTRQWSSALVRAATGGGEASHARLYVGLSNVIEAVPEGGVRLVPLTTALENDEVAIAVRRPNGLTREQKDTIVDYAMRQAGKEYDWWGAFNEIRLEFEGRTWQPDFEIDDTKRLYCSNLVINAYREAGVTLIDGTAPGMSPNDIVPLQWFGALEYLGHIKN